MRVILALLLAYFGFGVEAAFSQAPFYQGKTITVVLGGPPAGSAADPDGEPPAATSTGSTPATALARSTGTSPSSVAAASSTGPWVSFLADGARAPRRSVDSGLPVERKETV